MWGRKVPIFLLLQVCLSFVSIHRGLKNISLSPHETALIDIAGVFSGHFLHYEIQSTAFHQVEIELSAALAELTVETQCKGNLHILPVLSNFVIAYSGRRIEVWDTVGSEPTLTYAITTDYHIEGLSTVGDSMRFVYWSKSGLSGKREFYVGNIPEYSHAPAQLDGVYSDPGTPVCATGSHLFTITLQDSPLGAQIFKYVLDLKTLQILLDFSTFLPYQIIDMHCDESPVLLTPLGILKNYGLMISLEYIKAISGQFLRLLYDAFTGQISIETENGLLHVFGSRDVEFIPRGKFVFSASSYNAKVLIPHNENWLLSLNTQQTAMQSSAVIPIPLKERAGDIREFVSRRKSGLLDQWYLVFATNQGLAWYSLRLLHFPYLKVTSEAENFSFDLCACNYFDRSDSACAAVYVFAQTSTVLLQGSPVTSSSALDLQCTVTDIPQKCEYDLSELFFGTNLGFNVQLPESEVEYSAEIGKEFVSTQLEFILSAENMLIGCSENYDSGGLTIVLLGGNRLMIVFPSTGETQEKKAEDGISLLNCEIKDGLILLYGLVEDSLKTLFTFRISPHERIEKTVYSGFSAVPKLLRSDVALIAALNSQLVLFAFPPVAVDTLSFDSPVLDVTSDGNNLLVLIAGRLLYYKYHNTELTMTDSVAIDSKEVAIALTDKGVVACDHNSLVTLYYVRTDMVAEALFSILLTCDYLKITTFGECALLMCREAVYMISLTSRVWKSLAFTDKNVNIVHANDWKTEVCLINCDQMACSAILIKTASFSISPFLQLTYSSSQFPSNSQSSAFQLTITSSHSAPLSLPVSITFLNSGTFVTVVPGSREIEVDLETDTTVPVWTFFTGNELNLSMETEAAGVSLVPASQIVHKVHCNCFFPKVYFVVAKLLLEVCYEHEAISFYKYSCENGGCVTKLEATHQAADLGMVRIDQVDFLWHYESLVVFSIVAAKPAVHDTNYLFISSFSDRWEYKELWNSEYAHNRKSKLYIIEENAKKCHVFMYGIFFQHLELTYSQNCRMEVHEILTAGSTFTNILSVSAFRANSELHLLLLDREKRLYSFSLHDPNPAVTTTHLAELALQQYDGLLLQGQALFHATDKALNEYSLPEFRLISSLSLGIAPETGSIARRLEAFESFKSLMTLSWGLRHTLVINTSAPQFCSVLCSLPYKDVQLDANYMIGLGRETFDLIQIHTPALLINGSNQESTLNVNLTATNPHSSPATVNITVFRVKRKHWRTIAPILILSLVGGACWYIGKRRCRIQRKEQAEMEMENLRVIGAT